MKKLSLSVLIATVAFTGILLLSAFGGGVEMADEGTGGGYTTYGNKVGG
ncbi:hypothetical protein [Peribacillus butanolivorans]|nr:hypothetical protein [Peribacillus butanolivorans]